MDSSGPEVATRSFDEQVGALVRSAAAGDEDGFRSELERARPAGCPQRSVLTPSRDLVPVATLAERVEREGRGVVLGHLEPQELAGFVPIEAVELPDAAAYMALDVDLGEGSRNVRPEDALREILAAGRSPLTIDEGIALMLQQPDAIAPTGLLDGGLPPQRPAGPGLLGGEAEARLALDRNPHTWLGTASCAGRA